MKFINVKNKNNYEMADQGLHNKISSLIDDGDGKEALILGSGTGVFDKKLYQKNYKITSVDINDNNYIFDKNFFIKANLNEDFHWTNYKYDLIIASEIIEHIENTNHFLREISKKLKQNGVLILTTPNILEKTSIINLLIFGHFRSFDEKAFDWGHINPIFPHILKYHLKKNNLKIIRETVNRTFFSQLIIHTWRSIPYYIFLWFLSNFIKIISPKKYKEGVVLIYLIQKNKLPK